MAMLLVIRDGTFSFQVAQLTRVTLVVIGGSAFAAMNRHRQQGY